MKSKRLNLALFGMGLLCILMSCDASQNNPKNASADCTPSTLKGAQFASEFYHYVNHYSFETDSTGFSENGQLFWSIGLDTTGRSSAQDSVMYANPEPFRYFISDSILTIEYTSADHPESDQFRIFHFNCSRNQWISTHEFTYGKEHLMRIDAKILQRKWDK